MTTESFDAILAELERAGVRDMAPIVQAINAYRDALLDQAATAAQVKIGRAWLDGIESEREAIKKLAEEYGYMSLVWAIERRSTPSAPKMRP